MARCATFCMLILKPGPPRLIEDVECRRRFCQEGLGKWGDAFLLTGGHCVLRTTCINLLPVYNRYDDDQATKTGCFRSRVKKTSHRDSIVTDRRPCSYTLWDFWIDTHVHPPLKRHHVTGKVIDSQRKPKTIDFYRDVPQIMHRLQAAGVTIAACSRTDAPSLWVIWTIPLLVVLRSALTCCTRRAREALDLILIPPRTGSDSSAKPIPAIKFFDQLEIYPSSKIRHFKKLHEKTGIPYDEMVSRWALCMKVILHVWLAILRRRMEESGGRRTWYVNLRTNETPLDWRQVY